MHNKGSFPHKYKKGQVVLWINGVYHYVQITQLKPLHCDGASPNYRVFGGDARFRDFTERYTHGGVSESVLRALTAVEIRGEDSE